MFCCRSDQNTDSSLETILVAIFSLIEDLLTPSTSPKWTFMHQLNKKGSDECEERL